MKPGLPLANPDQAGLLVEGQVFQAFGNWIGTSQTLDLILGPSVGSPRAPKNVVINWKAGTPLAAALAETLAAAFPGATRKISISGSLAVPYDQPGYFTSLYEFSAWLQQVTARIVGGGYTGVKLVMDGGVIRAYDGTSPPSPKAMEFRDLIGQPTWIDFNKIQITMVMRGDLDVGDYIKLPPQTIVTQTASSFPRYRDKSAFQGTFEIALIHHCGHYRQPTAASWVTVVDAFAVPRAA
ncbi:MAG TPA: hypothetical protein VGU20_16820 [Stellaceae bacterium]|nr:hypothetical protein [Stellaceae bacterium]